MDIEQEYNEPFNFGAITVGFDFSKASQNGDFKIISNISAKCENCSVIWPEMPLEKGKLYYYEVKIQQNATYAGVGVCKKGLKKGSFFEYFEH